MKLKALIAATLILAMMLAGCGGSTSPEDAKKQLAEKKIAFNEHNFVQAVSDNNEDVIDLFLDAGMSPNVVSDIGSPITTAAATANLDLLKRFVEKGAAVNPTTKGKGGMTPLLAALLSDKTGKPKIEAVKFLLEKGADTNALFDTGKGTEVTPLMLGALISEPEIVKMIIDKKVDVNAVEKANGFTALTFAVTNENAEVVKVLLDGGANPNIKSKGGKTVLDIAKNGKDAEIAKLLLAAGAK